jgi:hypothetical protein
MNDIEKGQESGIINQMKGAYYVRWRT